MGGRGEGEEGEGGVGVGRGSTSSPSKGLLLVVRESLFPFHQLLGLVCCWVCVCVEVNRAPLMVWG